MGKKIDREQRRRRLLQIVFSIIAILVILSWILSLIVSI